MLATSTSTTDPTTFPWQLITVWSVLRLLQGAGMNASILNSIANALWLSAQQYSSREIQMALFAHLHSLSLKWHLSRSTGEVLRVMDRGTGAVTQLLSMLLIQILPILVDVVVAVVYLATSFNWIFAVITFVTMVLYLRELCLLSTQSLKSDHAVHHRIPHQESAAHERLR